MCLSACQALPQLLNKLKNPSGPASLAVIVFPAPPSHPFSWQVLPPLLNELKNPATQLLALPWVLEVVEVQVREALTCIQSHAHIHAKGAGHCLNKGAILVASNLGQCFGC